VQSWQGRMGTTTPVVWLGHAEREPRREVAVCRRAAQQNARDVVDALVTELSLRNGADIVSDDADEIRKLLAVANVKTSILAL